MRLGAAGGRLAAAGFVRVSADRRTVAVTQSMQPNARNKRHIASFTEEVEVLSGRKESVSWIGTSKRVKKTACGVGTMNKAILTRTPMGSKRIPICAGGSSDDLAERGVRNDFFIMKRADALLQPGSQLRPLRTGKRKLGTS